MCDLIHFLNVAIFFPITSWEIGVVPNNENEFIKNETKDKFLIYYQKLLIKRHTTISDTFWYIITKLCILFMFIEGQVKL